MKAILRTFLALILGATLLWRCDEVAYIEPAFGYEYWPLQLGQYWEYSVDSIQIFPAGSGTTGLASARYQWREVVVDTFTDLEGQLVYEVERLRRDSGATEWVLNDVARLEQRDQRTLRTVSNRTYVELVHPPAQATTWDALRYFDASAFVAVRGGQMDLFKEWQAVITEVEKPYQGALSFDNTLEVTHADFETVIELRDVRAYYAPGVGMVGRVERILDTQCNTCFEPWVEKAELGYIVTYDLVRYGVE